MPVLVLRDLDPATLVLAACAALVAPRGLTVVWRELRVSLVVALFLFIA